MELNIIYFTAHKLDVELCTFGILCVNLHLKPSRSLHDPFILSSLPD